MMPANTLQAADLYCGAGGASAGLFAAAKRSGIPVHLTAINHWDVAIATHSRNFPGQVHLCADVEKVKAKVAVPSGRLDLLLAGPSCVHFSSARGGVPVDEQQRASAWEIIHWCRDIQVTNILVENVTEFKTWGPLIQKRDKKTGELLFDKATGKPLMIPDPARKGMYFREWIKRFTTLGYNVEYRVLNAANFGDATTRKRLFIQARKGRPIVWPKPTHYAPDVVSAFPGTDTWRTARGIIDWSLPSQSIYGRKKPLAKNTLKRIFAGLRKFCGRLFSSAIVGSEFDGLCEPFLVVFRKNCDGVSLDEPLPTVCTSTGHFGLCQPFLVTPYGPRGAQGERSIDEPLNTILADNHTGVVQPYLTKFYGGHDSASLDAPLGAITANYEHYGLVQPYLVRYNGGDRIQSLDNPLTTLDTSNRFGLVQPFLINYYGNGDAQSVDTPIDTITTKDRFGLVSPELVRGLQDGDQVYLLDIHFRMLQPHELALAHSFPTSYVFTGKREDRVRQVGNSWPVGLATALCAGLLQ